MLDNELVSYVAQKRKENSNNNFIRGSSFIHDVTSYDEASLRWKMKPNTVCEETLNGSFVFFVQILLVVTCKTHYWLPI